MTYPYAERPPADGMDVVTLTVPASNCDARKHCQVVTIAHAVFKIHGHPDGNARTGRHARSAATPLWRLYDWRPEMIPVDLRAATSTRSHSCAWRSTLRGRGGGAI
jgi:hypothetical protein